MITLLVFFGLLFAGLPIIGSILAAAIVFMATSDLAVLYDSIPIQLYGALEINSLLDREPTGSGQRRGDRRCHLTAGRLELLTRSRHPIGCERGTRHALLIVIDNRPQPDAQQPFSQDSPPLQLDPTFLGQHRDQTTATRWVPVTTTELLLRTRVTHDPLGVVRTLVFGVHRFRQRMATTGTGRLVPGLPLQRDIDILRQPLRVVGANYPSEENTSGDTVSAAILDDASLRVSTAERLTNFGTVTCCVFTASAP